MPTVKLDYVCGIWMIKNTQVSCLLSESLLITNSKWLASKDNVSSSYNGHAFNTSCSHKTIWLRFERTILQAVVNNARNLRFPIIESRYFVLFSYFVQSNTKDFIPNLELYFHLVSLLIPKSCKWKVVRFRWISNLDFTSKKLYYKVLQVRLVDYNRK